METKEIVLPQGWSVDKIENGKIILKPQRLEMNFLKTSKI